MVEKRIWSLLNELDQRDCNPSKLQSFFLIKDFTYYKFRQISNTTLEPFERNTLLCICNISMDLKSPRSDNIS